MKNGAVSVSSLMFILSGCELAGDIFQAGVLVGVLVVVGLIALAAWMFNRAKH